MQLHLKTMSGSTFTVQVDPDSTVRELKMQAQEIREFPADLVRLIYNGKVLKNDQTVDELAIKDDSTLNLVAAMRGGWDKGWAIYIQ